MALITIEKVDDLIYLFNILLDEIIIVHEQVLSPLQNIDRGKAFCFVTLHFLEKGKITIRHLFIICT